MLGQLDGRYTALISGLKAVKASTGKDVHFIYVLLPYRLDISDINLNLRHRVSVASLRARAGNGAEQKIQTISTNWKKKLTIPIHFVQCVLLLLKIHSLTYSLVFQVDVKVHDDAEEKGVRCYIVAPPLVCMFCLTAVIATIIN